MHRAARLIIALLLLAAIASIGAAQSAGEPLEASARRALAEARAAEAQYQRLQKAANEARDELQRLRAQQAASAEAIAAAEARISAADVGARLIAAQVAARRQHLRREQAPASALLGGLAVMAERPPLLAILDQGSTEEFIRVRLLLDSTLPVIRARTASLRADLSRGRQLQTAAERAKSELVASRNLLAERRRDFTALEAKTLKIANERGSEALGVGDVALARGEDAARLSSESQRRNQAWAIAADLSRMPAPPARPGVAGREATAVSLAYELPSAAPVVEGLGAVAPNGVRSRGLTLATARGSSVDVPASGRVRFSGPFRSYDSIVIIEHENGWMSLLLNVASPRKAGEKVVIGQPLGRALGRIGVELSRNGRHVSPAIIAGSSQSLSKEPKRG